MAFTLEEVKETIEEYTKPNELSAEKIDFLGEIILAEIEAAVERVFQERIPN